MDDAINANNSVRQLGQHNSSGLNQLAERMLALSAGTRHDSALSNFFNTAQTPER